MRHPKLLLAVTFILSFPFFASAQLHLQEATIHPNMKRIGGVSVTATTHSMEYFIIDEFARSTGARVIDMDPDPDVFTPVSTELTLGGYFVAKYDSSGKYLKHTTIQRGAERTFSASTLATNGGLYVIGNCKDSVQFGDLNSAFTPAPSDAIYLVKFKNDLTVEKTATWDRDSAEVVNFIELPSGELVLYIIYQGDYKFPFSGTNATAYKYRPSNKTQYHNLLVKLDKNLNYVSHYNFNKGGRGTNDLQLHYDAVTSSILVGSQFIIDTKMDFNGDSIKKNGTSPAPEVVSALLRFDTDLNPLAHLDLRTNNMHGFKSMFIGPNGQIAVQGLQSITAGGVRLSLFDRNFNHIITRQAEHILSGTKVFQFSNGLGYNGKHFTFIHSGPSMIFPSKAANLNPIRLLELTVDSLKLVNNYELNDHINDIVYNDHRGVMTQFKMNGQNVMAKGYGNSPDFKLGSFVHPTIEVEGVQRWDSICAPLEVRLLHDTMSKCGDQYSDYRYVGEMKVIATGTGVSYQWYTAADTSEILLDANPSFQGAYKRLGSQTNTLDVSSGITGHSQRYFRAKVGSTCAAPIWTDTVVQMLWGTPRLLLFGGNTLYQTEGDSAEIQMFLKDEYPLDSIYFKWWLNDEEINDDAHYSGTDSLHLRINNLNQTHAGFYECRAYRYHCKDPNKVDWGKVGVFVETNSVQELAQYGIQAYPNPTTDVLNINSKYPIEVMNVYSSNGVLVHTIKSAPQGSPQLINLSAWSAGVYTCKLYTQGKVLTFNILKK